MKSVGGLKSAREKRENERMEVRRERTWESNFFAIKASAELITRDPSL
jgi:hypothetical protein